MTPQVTPRVKLMKPARDNLRWYCKKEYVRCVWKAYPLHLKMTLKMTRKSKFKKLHHLKSCQAGFAFLTFSNFNSMFCT